MKRIIILVIVLASGFGSFAQKSKNNQLPNKMQVAQNTYTCPMHPDVVSDKPGKCPKCGMNLNLSKKEQMKMEAMKIYTCPMHSDVVSNTPGECSKCGMKLIEKKKPSYKNEK